MLIMIAVVTYGCVGKLYSNSVNPTRPDDAIIMVAFAILSEAMHSMQVVLEEYCGKREGVPAHVIVGKPDRT